LFEVTGFPPTGEKLVLAITRWVITRKKVYKNSLHFGDFRERREFSFDLKVLFLIHKQSIFLF